MIISTDSLKEALNICGKAVNSKSLMPILANVKFEVNNGVLSIHATNLEVSVEVLLPVSSNNEADTVEFTVPFAMLNNWLKPLEAPRVNVELTESKAKFQCGKAIANFPTIDPMDFPVTTLPEPKHRISIPSDDLKMLLNAGHCSASDLSRPILQSLRLEFKGCNVKAIGADGFRLCVYDWEIKDEHNCEVMFPASQVSIIKSILDDGDVILEISDNRFTVKSEIAIVSLPTINGMYPDYNQILDNFNPETEFKVSKDDIIMAIQASLPFAEGSHSSVVKIQLQGDSLLLSGMGGNDNEIEIPVSSKIGDDKEIGINGKMLMEAIDQDVVTIKMKDEMSPIVVETDVKIEIIMPMQFK